MRTPPSRRAQRAPELLTSFSPPPFHNKHTEIRQRCLNSSYERRGAAARPHVASTCAASLRTSSRMLRLRLESTCRLVLLLLLLPRARSRTRTYTHAHTRLRLRTGEGAAMRQQATPSPSPRTRLPRDVIGRRQNPATCFLLNSVQFYLILNLKHCQVT